MSPPHGLPWQQYQEILNALPQTRAAHLIFDRGTLEITMPLEEHEFASERMGLFLRILVVETGLRRRSLRPTTLWRY